MDEDVKRQLAECQPDPDPLPNRILRFVVKSIFYAATGDALLTKRTENKEPKEYTVNK